MSITIWLIALAACIAAIARPSAGAESLPTTGPVSDAGKISFTLASDAHVTIAIDDSAGVRVRNLFADVAFPAGAHNVEWDGRDDNGKKVPAGSYRWRGLSRGNLHAVYQGSFQYGTPPWLYGKTGAWAADHSYPLAITVVGERVLIGSTWAENGHGLIATDLDGHKLWGIRWLNKRPWSGGDALATVGQRVFGSADLKENAVWEIDPGTGDNWLVVELKDLPADQINTEGRLPGCEAQGLRVIGGRSTTGNDGELFVADLLGKQPRTYVFSTRVKRKGDRLRLLRVLPVRPWSVTWLPDGRCVAAMDKSLDLLDPQTGQTTPLVSPGLDAPFCVTSDSHGRLFVSDQGGTSDMKYNPNSPLPVRGLRLADHASMQIKIFDSHGKLLHAMGKEGGQQPGTIDPNDFWRPAGIALDSRGRLWVTEMTNLPKRVSVWDVPDELTARSPALSMQFFGPTGYGGGAAMVDPAKPWRIMDTLYGVIFDVNLETGAYKPVEFPWRPYLARTENSYRPDLPLDGKPTTHFKVDGRIFSFLQGGYQHGAEAHWMPYTQTEGDCGIGEIRNGLFVPMAAIGNIRMLLRGRELNARWEEQWLAPPLLEAAKRRPDWKELCAKAGMDPNMTDAPHVEHRRGSGVYIASPWPKELSGFIWVDANGDGKMQPEEIELGDVDDTFGVTLDSQLNAYMTIASEHGQEPGVVKLHREGFNAVGAPVYHWAKAKRVEGTEAVQVGDDGSILGYTSLRSADGQLRWSYPSDPRGTSALGGSKWHEMLPGAINRIQAFHGIARGPADLGDVYLLQSIDGMCYLLTRDDGLFIGTLFKPYAFASGWDSIPQAKRGINLEDYSLQDECFNSAFQMAEASGQGFLKGHYYLTGMGRSAVVEVTGLDTVQRFAGGTVQLVEGVGLFAKAEPTPPVPLSPPPGIASHSAPSTSGPIEAAAGSQFRRSVHFADNEVAAAWDARGLHLKYVVSSASTLFINNESDWTVLFSTGDVCDLQIKSPLLGKCRYIITNYQGKPTVVRFQYDATEARKPVSYKSGVAETRVPIVEQLDLDIEVRRLKDSYAVQLTLPWDVLGIEPKAGLKLPVELGVFRADPTGTRVVVRNYWHSGAVGMVADLPTEAAPTNDWGVMVLR